MQLAKHGFFWFFFTFPTFVIPFLCSPSEAGLGRAGKPGVGKAMHVPTYVHLCTYIRTMYLVTYVPTPALPSPSRPVVRSTHSTYLL